MLSAAPNGLVSFQKYKCRDTFSLRLGIDVHAKDGRMPRAWVTVKDTIPKHEP